MPGPALRRLPDGPGRGGWLALLLGAVLAAGAPLPAPAQIFKLPHPDTTSGNFFGVAVALDGDRALVGASGEDSCGNDGGAAYIFERDARTDEWLEVARLVPGDCSPGSFFGRSVSLSGDRALIAASAEFFAVEASNGAYVFERDSAGAWNEVTKLTVDPPEPEGTFAASVSLDGDRALVTTWGDPSGARYGGAAYIYDRDPATGRWHRRARLRGSRGLKAGIFGGKAALDGDRAVVASSAYFGRGPGSIYLFERDAKGNWQEAAHLGGIDDFFISVDLEGDRLLVGQSKGGERNAGAATLYSCRADACTREALLHSLSPYDHGAFGSAVSLDGDRALIAGYDEQLGLDFNIDRVVYVFAYHPEAGAWVQQSVVDIGEVAFGAALDLSGPFALIGHASEREPGAAYVVRLR